MCVFPDKFGNYDLLHSFAVVLWGFEQLVVVNFAGLGIKGVSMCFCVFSGVSLD
jgi:hypothetical protein